MLSLPQDRSAGRPGASMFDEWFRHLGIEGRAWQVALILLACLLAFVLFRVVVLRTLDRLAQRTDNDLDDRLVQFARKFAGWVFLFLAVLAVSDVLGWNVSPLLAGAGIAGIALGFAAKEVLADILAGIFLIADRPFRTGDRVKIERIGSEWGAWGDVVDLGLRRTRVRNTDGVIVNYPNSVLANSVITNFSFEQEPVRIRVRFQVPFDADIDRVREVGVAAIGRAEAVIDGSVDLIVRSLWDVNRGHQTAGILIEGRFRIADVRDRTRVRSAVFEHLLRDFRAAGIGLAVPEVQVRGRG